MELTEAEKISLKEEVFALSQEVNKIDSRILVHSEVKMEMLRPPLVPWFPSLLNRPRKTKASPLKEEKKRPPKKIKTSLEPVANKKNEKKKSLTPPPEPTRVSPRPRSVSPRPATRRSGGSFDTPSPKPKSNNQNSKSSKSLPSKRPPAPKINYNPVLLAPEWNRRRIQHRYDPDEVLEFCHKILNDLMQHENSWPFLQPVDVASCNIPDYPDIIKHPMDLGTIKEKLKAEQYTHFKDFVDDVSLVWNNCMTYNGAHLEIHQMAKELSLIFNAQMRARKRLVEKNVPILQTAYHRRALEQLKILHSKLKKQQQSLQPKQKQQPKPKAPKPKRPPKPKAVKKDSEAGSGGGGSSKNNKKGSGGTNSGAGSLSQSLSSSNPGLGVPKIVHHNPNGSSSTTTSATSDSSSDSAGSESEDKVKPKKKVEIKNGEGRSHGGANKSFNQAKSVSGEGVDAPKWSDFRNSSRKSITSSRDKAADGTAKKTPEEVRREEFRRRQMETKRNDENRANFISRSLGHSGEGMMPTFNMPMYGMGGYGMPMGGMGGLGLGMGMNMGMAPPGMVPTGMGDMSMHMAMGPGMQHHMMGMPPGIQNMLNNQNRMPPPIHGGGMVPNGVGGVRPPTGVVGPGGVVVQNGPNGIPGGGSIATTNTRPPPPAVLMRTQPPPVAAVIK